MRPAFLIGLSRRVEYFALALIAFVPTVLLHSGVTNADTKLYLTSNPWKLLRNAQYAWDPSQFGGYVPHQAVGYLWPSGPFYLVLHSLHISPWLIQRIWVATLFLLAGLGVRWCTKHLGLQRSGAFIAAVVYQVTPFVLAYQTRTSVLLLPWVGLGWICGIILLAIRNSGWKYPALLALVVFSVGGINATALIMIAPAPLLLIIDALVDRRIRLRGAAVLVSRSVVLCGGVSLWWAAMIAIQNRYGAKVLSYSETLESVSSTSTSVEVVRGMGYWLNYVTEQGVAATSSASRYLSSPLTIFLTLAIPALGILGIALTHLLARRVTAWLVLVGAVLAVGVYPLLSASRLMSPIANHQGSSAALALRSSTRAYPVLLLGIAFGVGALVQKILSMKELERRPLGHFAVVALASALVVGAMPSLWTTGTTDPNLSREQSAPKAWQEAGSLIDEISGSSSRVLQLPGQEFGAYNWGFTVDPALPTVTDAPIITRDLLPLGQPQVMDLLFSLDDAAQNQTLGARALSGTAKKLGVSSLFVPHDLDTQRFMSADASSLLADPDLGASRLFSSGKSSASVAKIADSSVARTSTNAMILSGSGAGVVNAAQHGLVNDSLLRYSADMTPRELSLALQSSPLVVTDSNRLQTRHWRTSIDTLGYSQDMSTAGDFPAVDLSDRRLPIFDHSDKQSNTIVSQSGQVISTASSYGTPLSYWPESRPFFALDGDPLTAWTTAANADPYGATLHLRSKQPLDHLKLLQPQNNPNRWLNLVVISLDRKTWIEVPMTPESRTTGQIVTLSQPATDVFIALIGLDWRKGTQQTSLDGVGFAEVVDNKSFTTEETLLPSDAISATGAATPVSIVMSREQASPQRWWRSDPELLLNRTFKLAYPQQYDVVLGASLHADSPETLTAKLLGVTTTASEHSRGSFEHAGWYATDSSDATSWQTRIGHTTAASISFDVTSKTPEIFLTQCSLASCNAITNATITDGTTSFDVAIPESDNVSSINTSALSVGRWTLTANSSTDRVFFDSRFGKNMLYPLQVFSIKGSGINHVEPTLPKEPQQITFNVDSKQLTVDVTFSGTVTKPIVSMLYDKKLTLDAGLHTIRTSSYNESPISIDDVALVNDLLLSPAKQTNLSMSGSPTRRTVTLPPSATTQWFVFGEGYSSGWVASLNGKKIQNHVRADGGFNAWLVDAHDTPATITLSFAPQRYAYLAQLLSVLMVLLCLGILWRCRRSPTLPVHHTESVSSPSPSMRARLLAVVAFGLLTEFIIDFPSWKGFLLLCALLIVSRWRTLLIVVAAGLPAYRIWGAFANIRDSDLTPRFDWPTNTASSHQGLLYALIVFAVLVTLTTPRQPSN